MKKITPQFMPQVQRAPHFIEAVLSAKHQDNTGHQGSPVIAERLDSFHDDPFLLYACLWYAYSEGVAVTFAAAT